MMVTCMNDPGSGATPGSALQPGLQPVLLRDAVHAGADRVHGHAGDPDVGLRATATTSPTASTRTRRRRSRRSTATAPDHGCRARGTGHTLTDHRAGRPGGEQHGYSGPRPRRVPSTRRPSPATTASAHVHDPAAGSATCNTVASVTVSGVAATILSWSDQQIVCAAPGTCRAAPSSSRRSTRAERRTGPARCGQLVITAANGKKSIDTVTVTIGGKAPTHVPRRGLTIQAAIDAAAPGDLIIVDPRRQRRPDRPPRPSTTSCC